MGILSRASGWWRAARSAGRDESTPVADRDDATTPTAEDIDRLVADGRRREASLAAARAAQRGSTDARTWIAIARALEGGGRRRDAMRAIARSVASVGHDELPALDRAYAALRQRRWDDAIPLLRRCVDVAPDDLASRADLARALAAAGDVAAAARAWRDVLAHEGSTPEHVVACAGLDFRTGRAEEALVVLTAALARHPASAAIHAAAGAALYATGRTSDAIERYADAARLAGADGDPDGFFVDHAIALCAAARTREGADVLMARLPGAPIVRGHQQLATAALALGAFPIGWQQLEHRWIEGPVAAVRPRHALPAWKGQDLRGRTLLVRAEQGIGDTIQFARYLPRLKALGARVLFVPLDGMGSFSSRFAGVDRCVANDVDLRGIDAYIDLMSIPRVLSTTLETIPPVAALAEAPPDVQARWAERLGAVRGPRVGLVWAGRPEHPRDRERSIPFEQLRSLLAVADVRWYAMQKGPAAARARQPSPPSGFVDLAAELDTLDDAAEALRHVDVLVTVDTALAHLAGTLGRPVWMLVPQPADCRWLEHRQDSPWYPSMTLFRQETAGDWTGPLDRVVAAVRRLAATGASAPALHAATDVRGPPPLVGHGTLAQVIDTRHGLLQYVPDDGDEARALDRCGEWRWDEIAMATALARAGTTCVEVGSSFGQHALTLARAVGVDGEVIACEDRPVRRRVLANNARHHGLEQLTVVPAAPLDDMALLRLDGIKVNLPVNPGVVLDGALASVERWRPWIVLAVDGETNVEPLAERLRGLGYRTWLLRAQACPRPNFNRVEDAGFGGEALTLVALPDERASGDVAPGCVELT